MLEDKTWRNLGKLLENFAVNSNGDIIMRHKAGQTLVGNVQDGRAPALVLHFAIRSI